MFAKLKSKWVLIVIGVLLIILIIVAVLMGRQSPKEGGIAPEGTPTTDEPIGAGELPQGTGGGATLPRASATISPAKTATATSINLPATTQEVGYLDWSQNLSRYQESVDLPAEVKEKALTGDYCKMANISDSWDDPFAKTMCGLTRFVGKQIFEPLDAFLCQLEGADYALNLNSNIKVRYINGMCLIEDRSQ